MTQPKLHPFNRPYRSARELDYIRQCLEGGDLAGDASFTKRCHAWLAEKTGCGKALLTTSCTAALEMTALLLGLEPGDEVIVPSFTFVSCANPYVLFGARVVFADVRPDTLTLDWATVEPLLTPRTKAVVMVHYAGITVDPDVLAARLAERGVRLIEDNAHGLLGSWRGRPFGSFGNAATLSFHESKNFTCGEGGALLLNEENWFARAEILREKGTNRSAFFRREVAKYNWVDVGSSYLAADILAAMLLAQFEEADAIQSRRGALWDRYQTELAAWAAEQGVRLPHVPAECSPSWHLYFIVFPDHDTRERAIQWFRDDGIETYFHYLPLHLSPMGLSLGGKQGQCPESERAGSCLLRLPLHPLLEEARQAQIIARLKDFRR